MEAVSLGIGALVPVATVDTAGDSARIERLGFDHVALDGHTPVSVILAAGAARTVPIVVNFELHAAVVPMLADQARERVVSRPPGLAVIVATHPHEAVTVSDLAACAATLDLRGGPHARLLREFASEWLPRLRGHGPAATLYAEDISEGQCFEFGDYLVTEEDIISFAERWDPLEVHTDPERARSAPLGVLCASGIHTQAIFQRLSAAGFHGRLAVVAGRGGAIRLPNPLTANSRVRGRAEILRIQLRSDDRAVLEVRSCLLAGESVVLEGTGTMLVLRRPAKDFA